MNDKNYEEENNYKSEINYVKKEEDDDDRKKAPPFILLVLFTTFTVLIALGLSFSAIKLIDSTNPINTIISIIRGEDKKDYGDLFELLRKGSEKYFFTNKNLPGDGKSITISLQDLIDAGIITEDDLKGYDKDKFDREDTIIIITKREHDYKLEIILDKEKPDIREDRREYYYDLEDKSCYNCNNKNSNLDDLFDLLREGAEDYFFDKGILPGDGESKTITLQDLIDEGIITLDDLKEFDEDLYDPNDTIIIITKDGDEYIIEIILDKEKDDDSDDNKRDYHYDVDEVEDGKKSCLNCNGADTGARKYIFRLLRKASEKYYFTNNNLPNKNSSKKIKLQDLIDAGLVTKEELSKYYDYLYDYEYTIIILTDNPSDYKMEIILDSQSDKFDNSNKRDYYYDKKGNGSSNNDDKGKPDPDDKDPDDKDPDDDNTNERYVITYVENYGGTSNGINLVNQFPVPDNQGILFEGENYVFNFALVIGKKTAGVYYEITAQELATNTLNPSYVKLYLEKNSKAVDFSYKNKKVKVYTDYKVSTHSEAAGKVIYSGYITETEALSGKIVFKMKMWISEDAVVNSDYNNKTFGVRVNTYAASIGG